MNGTQARSIFIPHPVYSCPADRVIGPVRWAVMVSNPLSVPDASLAMVPSRKITPLFTSPPGGHARLRFSVSFPASAWINTAPEVHRGAGRIRVRRDVRVHGNGITAMSAGPFRATAASHPRPLRVTHFASPPARRMTSFFEFTYFWNTAQSPPGVRASMSYSRSASKANVRPRLRYETKWPAMCDGEDDGESNPRLLPQARRLVDPDGVSTNRM